MGPRSASLVLRAARGAGFAVLLPLLLGQASDSRVDALERRGHDGDAAFRYHSCSRFSRFSTKRDRVDFFYARSHDPENSDPLSRERVRMPVKLALMAFEADCREAYGYNVSVTNAVASFRHTDGGSSGHVPPDMDPAQAAFLDGLLTYLPPEPPSPPPGDRRLLVGVPRGDTWKTYVYDRADLPEPVLDILRLIDGSIEPWVLRVEAQTSQDPPAQRAHYYNPVLALSPDGRVAVSGAEYEDLTLWDVETRTPMRAISATAELVLQALAFSPDGRYLAADVRDKILILDARSWETVTTLRNVGPPRARQSIAFTPDGEYLLLNGSKLVVYRTSSWEPLPELPNAPVRTLRYVGSPNGRWALIGTEDGSIELWDLVARKLQAQLDTDSIPAFAAFSPDQTMVAVATGRPMRSRSREQERHLRVWDLATGKLLRELQPLEVSIEGAMKGLLWTPGGDYLVGVSTTSPGGTPRSIDVWNLASGRHRAELVDGESTIEGIALTPDGKTLVAVTGHPAIGFWDFEDAMKDIAAFEASLPSLSK